MQNVNYKNLLSLESFSEFLNSLSCVKKNSTVAVAVSSGVDSMNLLHISDIWAKKHKKNLYVISYNHNLRIETFKEIHYVKKVSMKLDGNIKL